MGFLVNLGAKLLGIDMAKVNGWKTYTGGAIEMLTAVGGIAGAAVNILQELLKLSTPADYLAFAQAAAHGQDLYVVGLMGAVGLFGKGLADIGLAHKHDKLLDALKAEPAEGPAPEQPAAPPPAGGN